MQVVWFKRDLRTFDNTALHLATQTNKKILPLYILEPELWQQADMSQRHYDFLCESLDDLNQQLTNLGQPLIIKIGNAIDVFQDIKARWGIFELFSHQETWNGWTYIRDLNVQKWAKQNNIKWHEPVQNGVVRKLKSRDNWYK